MTSVQGSMVSVEPALKVNVAYRQEAFRHLLGAELLLMHFGVFEVQQNVAGSYSMAHSCMHNKHEAW